MNESLEAYCRRTDHEALLTEWSDKRNRPYTADSVGASSHRKVWWRCGKGHEWLSSPDCRKQGAACPYCSGKKPVPGTDDLMTLFPGIASQWHPVKNGVLYPRSAGDMCGGDARVDMSGRRHL